MQTVCLRGRKGQGKKVRKQTKRERKRGYRPKLQGEIANIFGNDGILGPFVVTGGSGFGHACGRIRNKCRSINHLPIHSRGLDDCTTSDSSCGPVRRASRQCSLSGTLQGITLVLKLCAARAQFINHARRGFVCWCWGRRFRAGQLTAWK